MCVKHFLHGIVPRKSEVLENSVPQIMIFSLFCVVSM